MTATQATAGFGHQLYIGDGAGSETFYKIGEMRSCKPADRTLGTADATHMESDYGFTERIPTLLSMGEADCEFNYLPKDSTQAMLTAAMDAKRLCNFKLVLPSGDRAHIFKAYVTKVSLSVPKDDAMVLAVTLSATGRAQTLPYP